MGVEDIEWRSRAASHGGRVVSIHEGHETWPCAKPPSVFWG